MSEFDFLAACSVSETSTADLQLLHIPGKPVLTLAPMTRENRAFLTEALKRPVRPAPRIATGADVEAALRAKRARDCDVMVKTGILRGWVSMCRPDGTEIPFTPQNGADFLAQLTEKAGWMFDQLVEFASDPANFVSLAPEDTAKNSVGG